MKKVKIVLVIIAIILHYLLLCAVGGQVMLLHRDFVKMEHAKMQRSISLTEIFTEHLKNQNKILSSGIKNAQKYRK